MNSPWNIAAEFSVDMSFTVEDIASMLEEYRGEHECTISVNGIAEVIYEYTSGYPYLVSKICKLIDERCNRNWTRQGVAEAVKILLKEANTLFDDLRKKIMDYPELRDMLYAILFRGESYPYNPDNFAMDIGMMFGFIKEKVIDILNKIKERNIDCKIKLIMYRLDKDFINEANNILPGKIKVAPIEHQENDDIPLSYEVKEILEKDRTLDVWAKSITATKEDANGNLRGLSPFEIVVACYKVSTHFKKYTLIIKIFIAKIIQKFIFFSPFGYYFDK